MGNDGKMLENFTGLDFVFWKFLGHWQSLSKEDVQTINRGKADVTGKDDWEDLDRQVLGLVRLILSKNNALSVADQSNTVLEN